MILSPDRFSCRCISQVYSILCLPAFAIYARLCKFWEGDSRRRVWVCCRCCVITATCRRARSVARSCTVCLGADGTAAMRLIVALLTGLMVRVATLVWPRSGYERASCCPRKVEQPASPRTSFLSAVPFRLLFQVDLGMLPWRGQCLYMFTVSIGCLRAVASIIA